MNEDAARDVAIAADLNPRRIVAVNEVEDAVVSASDPSGFGSERLNRRQCLTPKGVLCVCPTELNSTEPNRDVG